MMSVAQRQQQQQAQAQCAASGLAELQQYDRYVRTPFSDNQDSVSRVGYDVMATGSSCYYSEAVLQPAYASGKPAIARSHSSPAPASAFSPTSPPALTAAAKRAHRISLITSRSLFDIHEPETLPRSVDEDENEYARGGSSLGLDIYGHGYQAATAPYDPYATARNAATPDSAVPSLSYSAQTPSAGHSTGCATPTARLSFLTEQPDQPGLYALAPAALGKAARKEQRVKEKEGKLGKALLGKLKSFLLSPQSPSSANKDIKQSRTRLRRRKDKAAPVVEARSTSLYRTVDIPDPLYQPAASRDRRASQFCGGPYGNLAAYGHYNHNYAAAFESTVSFASPAVRPQQGYASVADFRHYSTAELPLDPTVPYSPYAEQETRRYSTLLDVAADLVTEQTGQDVSFANSSSDLRLDTAKVKLRQRGSTDWVGKSKQFWSSALDLTLPRSSKATMSTVELVSPQPVKASLAGPSSSAHAGLVPAPPIPARSRLRGTPSSLSLAGKHDSAASSSNATPTAHTPAPPLMSSPSNSSVGSASSGSASASLPSVSSPSVPVTPGTPPAHARKQSGGWKFGSIGKTGGSGSLHGRKISGPYSPQESKGEFGRGFGGYIAAGSAVGHSGWPGQLNNGPTLDSASQKRSRFSRSSRHSSSGSVSLSAASDPLRVKDGVAPRGSSSGVYTPITFPGPSPRPSYSQQSSSYSSYTSTTTLPGTAPSPGLASRSASGSSDASTSGSSTMSVPQTPTSPSAAASRMYNACVGAFSSWSIGSSTASGSGSGKRASQPAKPVSGPYSPVHVEPGPLSANAAYFPIQTYRAPSYTSQSHQQRQQQQLQDQQGGSGRHQASRSVSFTQDSTPVQVWSPSSGWTEAGAQAAGLGVGVEEEGNYVQGRTRSNTSATLLTERTVVMGDAPKGRRKPVPKPQEPQGAEEVHAL